MIVVSKGGERRREKDDCGKKWREREERERLQEWIQLRVKRSIWLNAWGVRPCNPTATQVILQQIHLS